MRLLRTLLPVLVLAAAATFALQNRWPWHRLHVVARPIEVSHAFSESSDTLRSGETLSDLFVRNGVGDLALSALAAGGNFDPRRLRAGLVFDFRQDLADSSPSQILFRSDPENRISLDREGENWDASSHPIVWHPEPIRLEGKIDQSLYVALDQQITDSTLKPGERVRLAWDLADTYMWQVDFTRDIRPGDHYTVLAERMMSDEGEIRFGRILAADLTIGGKSLPAFRYKDSGGKESFYDDEGNSLKRAFLRAPVEFRRISSGFTSSRYHPILNRFRAHEGTDYAADAGTPVMAAGNGTVIRAGRAGGYGNLIEISHANGITTRYGHLRGFAGGIHAGSRVSQGQVIAYVGSTGLATGPHLHYEFRIDGKARDSRRIDIANGDPIPAGERTAFEQIKGELAALLYRPGTTVALVPAGLSPSNTIPTSQQ
ncbi:MAG: peptidoglycan DD-metalloendopeptidase family protein [Gemmatimonadota bacterium]